MKLYRYCPLISFVLLISGCADLMVKDLQVRWNADSKEVEAEIANNGVFSAGEFTTDFKISRPTQQEDNTTIVTRTTTTGLDKGDTVSVVADFSQIASPENNFLNDSRTVKVEVNSDKRVLEINRANNTKTGSLKPLQVVLSKPTIRPKAVNISQQTEITFSIRIEGEDAHIKPTEVSLLSVHDGEDTSLANLNDDGSDPDYIKGDNIFSGKIPFQAITLEPATFYVTAVYEELNETAHSDHIKLQVLPVDSPTKLRRSDMTKIVTETNTNLQFLCNEIMVVAPHTTPFDSIRTVVQSVQGTVVGIFPGEKMNSWQVEIPCNGVQGVREVIATLQGHTGITLVEPHFVARITGLTPNDTDFPQQWGLSQIQADVAWALSRGVLFNGIPIAVAVLDTGVDYNHADLSNIWLGQDHVNGDADPMDDHATPLGIPLGHGTHVAGIVAATAHNNTGVIGVAQTVVIAEKVCDDQGSCTDGNIAEGIEHATDLGASIINLSLGRTGYSHTMVTAMDYANTRGRLIVAAAGNDNCSTNFYPAAFANTTSSGGDNFNTRVIAVGATDNNDQQSIWVAGRPQCTADSGSNFGAWVDISAPGSNIRSTIRNNIYDNWNGTSMATPHVAGTAALMWARHPWANANRIRDIVLATAENTGNNDPGGNGIRRLNAFHAVMQSAALNCAACPRGPEYDVQGNRVILGVAGRSRTDSQAMSRHGAGIPLLRATQYQIDATYNFETWDSYTPTEARYNWGWMGPRDAYSVSMSYGVPYWQQDLDTPIANTPSIYFPLIWGGVLYKDQVKETREDNLTFNAPGRSNSVWLTPVDFLNIILDTHNNDDFPSWGWVEILDITPVYTDTSCLTSQIAGQQFQVCNGP